MKLTKEIIGVTTIEDLLVRYPFIDSFFENQGLTIKDVEYKTIDNYLDGFDEEKIEDIALNKIEFVEQMIEHIHQMLAFLDDDKMEVSSITIHSGKNKSGENENFDSIKIDRGEIISIVGPTGSGKSRLLADIEWVAQNDTPTLRKIMVNDEIPDKKWRFSISDKLVAQLSQNMNFVMDLSVKEFIELHAESRMVENRDEIVKKIIKQANDLAGESFNPETPVTALSGGQSRALMIADTAILSKSPIVLIDEIENAGIDRKKALALLLSEDKIVLMATHDPILALMADKRVVIKNGGIDKILYTTKEERSILSSLEEMDQKMLNIRTNLRNGEAIKI